MIQIQKKMSLFLHFLHFLESFGFNNVLHQNFITIFNLTELTKRFRPAFQLKLTNQFIPKRFIFLTVKYKMLPTFNIQAKDTFVSA